MKAVACLLLAALVPLMPVHAQEDDAWIQPDPKGDLIHGALRDRPIAPVAAPDQDHVDLRRVTLRETEGELHVRLDVESLAMGVVEAPGAVLVALVRFHVEGVPHPYRLAATIVGTHREGENAGFLGRSVASPWLCIEVTPQTCRSQPAFAYVPTEGNALEFWVTRAALEGRARAPWATTSDLEPFTIKAGSKVTDLQVRLTGDGLYGAATFEDVFPNEGSAPAFVLRAGTDAGATLLEIGRGATSFTVVPGLNQSIPLRVQNNDTVKQRLALRYELGGPGKEHYRLTGPAAVSVPSGQTREYRLWLHAAGEATDAPAHVRVIGVGLAGQRVYASAWVAPGPALGPGTETLHLATGPLRNRPEVCQTAHASGCSESRLILSQPRGADARRLPANNIVGTPLLTSFAFHAELERPSATPVAFHPKAPIEVHVRLSSRYTVENALVRVFLDLPDQRLLSLVSQDVTTRIDPDGENVVVRRVPPERDLWRDLRPRLTVLVSFPTSDPGTGLEDVALLPEGTFVKLPLLETGWDAPPSAASPFQVFVRGEREEFVNPGESKLFNVTIMNYDSIEQRATLSGSGLPADWSVEFRPGQRFDLRPGETVNVGVLLRAPPDAPEATRGRFYLNVTSDAGGVTTLPLAAIVTSGVELDDESTRYVADPEALDRLVAPAPSATPGLPGWVLLLLVPPSLRGVPRRSAPGR